MKDPNPSEETTVRTSIEMRVFKGGVARENRNLLQGFVSEMGNDFAGRSRARERFTATLLS